MSLYFLILSLIKLDTLIDYMQEMYDNITLRLKVFIEDVCKLLASAVHLN